MRTLKNELKPSDNVRIKAHIKIIQKTREISVGCHAGKFKAAAYELSEAGKKSKYLILYKGLGRCKASHAPLVRLHSACFVGDIFGCDRCDCGWQLRESLRMISHSTCGVLVYAIDEEGRGTGLINKFRSYLLMDRYNINSFEAFKRAGLIEDERSYEGAVMILRDMGIRSVRIVTNNPAKVDAIKKGGIKVEGVVPTVMRTSGPRLINYLNSKRDKMGHFIVERQK